MLLRASGQSRNESFDLSAVMEGGHAGGVQHGELLLALVDAVIGDDDARLAEARRAIVDTIGPEALVDSAAVIATFSQMDRIADAAGIPLDEPLEMMTRDLRDELGVAKFASAANTPRA